MTNRWIKHQKKYHYLGTKNNLVGYCCPNYYSIIGPDGVGAFKGLTTAFLIIIEVLAK